MFHKREKDADTSSQIFFLMDQCFVLYSIFISIFYEAHIFLIFDSFFIFLKYSFCRIMVLACFFAYTGRHYILFCFIFHRNTCISYAVLKQYFILSADTITFMYGSAD